MIQISMIDAHNHLQDRRLSEHRPDILSQLRRAGIKQWVVNGTTENDWPEVAALADENPEVIPCFGLHPWFFKDRSPNWTATLLSFLEQYPGAGVGEVGLDKWIRDHRIEEQEILFREQIAIAEALNRPLMIHCLKAWGRMHDVLQSQSLPSRGFLLHSYGGPAEMIPRFTEFGAYFSISGYFMEKRKAEQREVFRQIPLDRLLIETDAPDMLLPEAEDAFKIESEGKRINHPGNLERVYEFVAILRNQTTPDLIEVVAENSRRFLRG